MMDFLLAKRKKEHQTVVLQMKSDRQEIVASIQTSFPHRRLLLDLLASVPSLRVESFNSNSSSSKTSHSPMTCLQYVDFMGTLITVDPFDVLNLTNTLLALLSSRLEDPLVEEHEKQFWITQFADSSFWMSTTRVALCISAMLRAKRYDELFVLQYTISLERWKKVSEFMSPDELTTVPARLQKLIRGQETGALLMFLDGMSKNFQKQYASDISNVMKLYSAWKSATGKGLQIMLASYKSTSDAFSIPERILNFSITCSLLAIKPEIKNEFRNRFSPILKLAKAEGLIEEFFPTGSQSLNGHKSPNFEFGVQRGETRCQAQEEAFVSLIVGVVRNFRQPISAFAEVGQRLVVPCLVKPEVFLLLANSTETGLFLKLCELICTYDLDTDNMMADMRSIGFNRIITSSLLSPHMKAILFEGVVGMHLCQGHFLSDYLREVDIGLDKSLSRTVGSLRGKQRTEVSIFVKVLNDIQSPNLEHPELISAAYAILMWAILPRIMDNDTGADEVMEALERDKNLHTNKQFQLIRKTAFRLMLECTSIESLRKVIPKLASCSIQVNKLAMCCIPPAHRRKELLSALLYLQTPSNCNLSLLLSVKQQVPEKSIEYMDRFYNGSAPLDPICLAHAIVEAITIIGQGKKKNIHILSTLLTSSIFLHGSTQHWNKAFFDRVKYELETYLHFSLLPADVKIYLQDLLSLTPEDEWKSRMLMISLIQLSVCSESTKDVEKKFVVETKSQPTVEKKQESKSEPELTPKPKELSRSKPRQNQPSILAKKIFSSNSQIANPVRPSRSRPTPISQTAKATPVTSGQNHQQAKSQQTASVQDKRPKQKQQDHTKKETFQPDTIPTQIEEIAKQKEIDYGQQLESAPQPSDAQAEKEEKAKQFILTIKLLRKYSNIQPDGHVVPKYHVSPEFKEYVEEAMSHGSLPFKLDKEFLSFVTKGKNREQYRNTSWKHIRDWKERVVWRPKLHTPVRVFLSGATMSKIAELKEYVFQLKKEQVARLQSLCYFSNLSSTNPDLKRAISRRTLKFIIAASIKSYQIENGMIKITAFPKSFLEFSNAISILTESAKTDISEGLSHTTKKTKVNKVKEESQAEESIQANKGDDDKSEIKHQEIATKDDLDQVEENVQKTSPLADSKIIEKASSNVSNQLRNTSIQQNPPVTSDQLNQSSHWKVDSPVFVPKNSDKTEHISAILKNFTQIRHFVTPSNYKEKLDEFRKFLRNGVEYIALDCEMTGLYTKSDEAEHSKNRVLMLKNNTKKLMEAVDHNMMFQLGLTVKTVDKKFSVWSFYTAPSLTVESFTPETFKFLFSKSQDVEVSKISNIAMNSVSVEHFLLHIFTQNIPLVLFSGYVDLMHVRKAANLFYFWKHEDFQKGMECDFYDVKQIALNILHKAQSLELLLQELYDRPDLDKEHLHDASFDSSLTALAFDRLKETYGADRMVKRVLFNYEEEGKKFKLN